MPAHQTDSRLLQVFLIRAADTDLTRLQIYVPSKTMEKIVFTNMWN